MAVKQTVVKVKQHSEFAIISLCGFGKKRDGVNAPIEDYRK
jgi:hypothetical protein